MTSNSPAQQSGGDVVLAPDVIDMFVSMIGLIPDAESGGQDNILRTIFAATTPEELEAPWNARDNKFPLGVVVRVESVAKRPSDYAGGLPFYMVCQATNLETGEATEYQTGSVSCTAQIAQAVFNEQLPIQVKLVQAAKASKNGYFPEHFEIIIPAAAKNGKR